MAMIEVMEKHEIQTTQKYVRELSFSEYHHHQRYLVSNDGLTEHCSHIKAAQKFTWNNNMWFPESYQGYALVSMLDAYRYHTDCLFEIIKIQDSLNSSMNTHGIYCMLPHDSFHQTIANTFSNKRYEKYIIDQGLEMQFPSMIADAVTTVHLPLLSKPIELKIIGIGILHNVIALIADIPHEKDYDAILHFRDHIYTYLPLYHSGLRRTRPFIGHISLAYIEKDLDEIECEKIIMSCVALNKEIALKNIVVNIYYTELRRYDNLSAFYRGHNFQRYWFCSHK